MNLLLLRYSDIEKIKHSDNNVLWLDDYRAEHLLNIIKATPGQKIAAGRINSNRGTATIIECEKKRICLGFFEFNQTPPTQLPVEVILALPRPRMLQRSLQTMATMGVKKIHLIQTERAEKSFWQTPLLKPETVTEQLILGAEQAKATQIPEIELHRKWRDFSREILPDMQASHKIIAHPGNFPQAKSLEEGHTLLAIGPEGGFTEDEVSLFIEKGFNPMQLGSRILRVETAVPVLLAKLFE